MHLIPESTPERASKGYISAANKCTAATYTCSASRTAAGVKTVTLNHPQAVSHNGIALPGIIAGARLDSLAV